MLEREPVLCSGWLAGGLRRQGDISRSRMMEAKANVLVHLDLLKAIHMSVDEVKRVPVFGREINMLSAHRNH